MLLHGKTLTENNIFEGFLFYPRNLILLSTPLFIFLFKGTRYILKNKSREIQILFVFTPLINILLLMLTASKYSHYGLFAIPLLASNADFGIYDSFQKKSNGSKLTLRIFGGLMLIISSLIFLVSILNFHLKILNQFNFIEVFIISLLSFILLILSLNLIYKTNSKALNINNILSIFSIQIFILSILFINGTIGNPNNEIKDFIYQPDIKKIIEEKQIFLIGGLEDKKLNLLKFYLPNYKVIENKQIHKIDQTIYGFISDKDMKQFNDSISTEFINLKEFKDINLIKINTAKEMLDQVLKVMKDDDLFIGCAAVSDYRPKNYSVEKLKKNSKEIFNLKLEKNDDILSNVSKNYPNSFVVGFAAETENIEENSRKKLTEKNLNMIISNDVSNKSIGFDSDDNEVTIYTENDILTEKITIQK